MSFNATGRQTILNILKNTLRKYELRQLQAYF